MPKRLLALCALLAIALPVLAVLPHFPTASPSTAIPGPVVRQVDDTARVAWADYKGAHHYVVTLQFQKGSGDAWSVDDTSMTTPPLAPNTRYTVCVTAVADTNSERMCVDFKTS